MVEKIATREAYGKKLVELADKYPELVVFDADLAGATMTKFFAAAHPERFRLFTPREYVSLVVDFLEGLSPRIAVERFVSQAPPGQLLAPVWGIKNDEFLHRLVALMNDRKTRQGIAGQLTPHISI